MISADELRGLVLKSKLPKGGVRRIIRPDTELLPSHVVHREKRREAHTKYLTKSEYRRKNKEKIAAQMRAWRAANQERIREHRKRWKEANPEKAKLVKRRASAAYRTRNLERLREYDRQWQAANWERVKANKRAYYAANKDRINAKRRSRRAP